MGIMGETLQYLSVMILLTLSIAYSKAKVQVNQDGMKLNGAHQILAYADNVNILGGSVHTVRENAEALVVATKEIGLEVNTDTTKYMVMSRDRNAERGHGVRIDNTGQQNLTFFL
jgi:hypothetical protein